jgi:hypothetical protein
MAVKPDYVEERNNVDPFTQGAPPFPAAPVMVDNRIKFPR